MSQHPAELVAMLPDGYMVSGETTVDDLSTQPRQLYLDPIIPDTKEAVITLENADTIILGLR